LCGIKKFTLRDTFLDWDHVQNILLWVPDWDGIVFREKGPVATRQLFTGIQRVVNFWPLHHDFNIGIGDTIADRGTMAFITQTIAERKANVMQIIEDASHDRLKSESWYPARAQCAQKNLKENNNA
jgi:DNA-directed RNA polymerase II subunit RPB1